MSAKGETMFVALTRGVSPRLADCELTYLPSQPIDVAKAEVEHRAYEECLTSLGVRVISLPASAALPDSVFIEDVAVVLDEIAVMTRPGAESRRAELLGVAPKLEQFRQLVYISAPATLDGGDVLHVDRTLFAGLSRRTDQAGIDQLRAIVEPFGYQVKEVSVTGCLHLKTGVTYLGRNEILINREWVDAQAFDGFELIDVPEAEPMAANTLTIGETLLLPDSFPQTRALLEARNYNVRVLDISELQKAEAGLTCSSLIIKKR
jgi:dimethylargininase